MLLKERIDMPKTVSHETHNRISHALIACSHEKTLIDACIFTMACLQQHLRLATRQTIIRAYHIYVLFVPLQAVP